MRTTEVGIYASLYCENLDDVESILAAALPSKDFQRIEQRTVLLYEGGTLALSVEPYGKSFYLSGRSYLGTSKTSKLLERVASAFAARGIDVSIEYQEEDSEGKSVSPCLTINTKNGPRPT